jgi:hypothetical protein
MATEPGADELAVAVAVDTAVAPPPGTNDDVEPLEHADTAKTAATAVRTAPASRPSIPPSPSYTDIPQR